MHFLDCGRNWVQKTFNIKLDNGQLNKITAKTECMKKEYDIFEANFSTIIFDIIILNKNKQGNIASRRDSADNRHLLIFRECTLSSHSGLTVPHDSTMTCLFGLQQEGLPQAIPTGITKTCFD